MTQYSEDVKKRDEELKEERDMNSITGIEIVINKPKNIWHMNTYRRNGEQVRSYKDKRKKDEIITEAYRS